MRVLVIHCHPDPASFGGALHGAVVESLAASSHIVTDVDLYRDGFDPLFSLTDRALYGEVDWYREALNDHANQLAAAEALVLIYPSWWFGMPAMLKGYFDRVWAPGIAYDVVDGRVDTSRLSGISRIGVVTTYGSSWATIRLYMGDPARKLINRGVRHLCPNSGAVEWHVLYDMDDTDERRCQAFLARVRRDFAAW